MIVETHNLKCCIKASEITSSPVSLSEKSFMALMSCDAPCAVSYTVFQVFFYFSFFSKSERKLKISAYHPLIY